MDYFIKGSGNTELLAKIKFALPAFHAYGHKASCQVCMTVILILFSLTQSD